MNISSGFKTLYNMLIITKISPYTMAMGHFRKESIPQRISAIQGGGGTIQNDLRRLRGGEVQ